MGRHPKLGSGCRQTFNHTRTRPVAHSLAELKTHKTAPDNEASTLSLKVFRSTTQTSNSNVQAPQLRLSANQESILSPPSPPHPPPQPTTT
ncbi:uncharacterized protein PITG_00137 [Phytophthora infestans T30-4]|uniref:Uncharacterized protein n=1 Tax=Phytophthora infestans (strain T30-4) TaxID=403677 RepID=D0MSZ4_PHYIT|nr:uncharacterized protein PITG_00137 [Phytophthora infestans T30-4]EEY57578.1 hypothetical protein PITG_00137 [Phytophthora infestans T30-4]|eukprot:XP_002908764.1 hypothetical protein PITG_00137 [Phytophthora infestans T30-4]